MTVASQPYEAATTPTADRPKRQRRPTEIDEIVLSKEAGVPQVHPEHCQTTAQRLNELRTAAALTTKYVRLTAAGHGVDERTVWRWLGRGSGSG